MHLQSYSEYINAINIITDNLQYHSGDYLYFYDELKHTQYNISEGENAIQFYYPLQLFESFPTKDPNSLLKNLDQSMYFYTELVDTYTKYGKIIIFLDTVKLTEMIPELDNIMIMNRSGETVFQGKNLENGISLSSTQDQIFRKQLKFHEWTLVYKVDAFIYQKQLDLIRQLAYFSLAISLMLTFVFSGYLSRQILLPASKTDFPDSKA